MEHAMHLTKTVFFFLLLTTAMNSASQAHAQNDSVISVPSISLKDIPQASQNVYATPPSLTFIPHSPRRAAHLLSYALRFQARATGSLR